jgi:hypothetical protein
MFKFARATNLWGDLFYWLRGTEIAEAFAQKPNDPVLPFPKITKQASDVGFHGEPFEHLMVELQNFLKSPVPEKLLQIHPKYLCSSHLLALLSSPSSPLLPSLLSSPSLSSLNVFYILELHSKSSQIRHSI